MVGIFCKDGLKSTLQMYELVLISLDSPLIHNDILFEKVCWQFIAPLQLHNFKAFQTTTTYEKFEN